MSIYYKSLPVTETVPVPREGETPLSSYDGLKEVLYMTNHCFEPFKGAELYPFMLLSISKVPPQSCSLTEISSNSSARMRLS